MKNLIFFSFFLFSVDNVSHRHMATHIFLFLFCCHTVTEISNQKQNVSYTHLYIYDNVKLSTEQLEKKKHSINISKSCSLVLPFLIFLDFAHSFTHPFFLCICFDTVCSCRLYELYLALTAYCKNNNENDTKTIEEIQQNNLNVVFTFLLPLFFLVRIRQRSKEKTRLYTQTHKTFIHSALGH